MLFSGGMTFGTKEMLFSTGKKVEIEREILEDYT